MSGTEMAKSAAADGSTVTTCDAELVVLIASGSQEALVEVYRRHVGYVYGVALRVVGPGALAEEVAQDVFLALWRQPDRYDPSRSPLRGYLAMMASRRAIDRLRSEAARHRREEAATSAEPADRSPVAECDRVATLLDMRDALATLSDEEREAIELAYFGGYSYREVALLLSQPEGTVKSRIRSGLSRIRRSIGSQVGEVR
ncbi:MAG: sigma-70 family RNA polymerase sigma factor [Nitrospiraceae bacterium]|nr:sigma-70 family RNA polymerase sigma factor [Nitrospiraceae bacterium]